MHLNRFSHSSLLGFTQDRDCNIDSVSRGNRRIPENQNGQVAVEFALMIIVIMIVTLSYMSITFLGTQGYLTKFASYTGARGYLAYSNGFGDRWRDGARQNSELIINREGQADIQRVGGGVRVKIRVQELFPVLRIYGPGGVMELEATTELGEEDPMDGDNVL